MRGGYGARAPVRDQNRHAVGCLNGDGNFPAVRNDNVGVDRRLRERRVRDEDARAVHLFRSSEVPGLDADPDGDVAPRIA